MGFFIEELNTKREAHARLLFGSHETSPNTLLVRSREMDGSQTLPWCRGGGGGGIKTTENKIHWPRCVHPMDEGTLKTPTPKCRVYKSFLLGSVNRSIL
jgi:hypothetical protein